MRATLNPILPILFLATLTLSSTCHCDDPSKEYDPPRTSLMDFKMADGVLSIGTGIMDQTAPSVLGRVTVLKSDHSTRLNGILDFRVPVQEMNDLGTHSFRGTIKGEWFISGYSNISKEEGEDGINRVSVQFDLTYSQMQHDRPVHAGNDPDLCILEYDEDGGIASAIGSIRSVFMSAIAGLSWHILDLEDTSEFNLSFGMGMGKLDTKTQLLGTRRVQGVEAMTELKMKNFFTEGPVMEAQWSHINGMDDTNADWMQVRVGYETSFVTFYVSLNSTVQRTGPVHETEIKLDHLNLENTELLFSVGVKLF